MQRLTYGNLDTGTTGGGTPLTATTAANTKSAWTQIVAGTGIDAHEIEFAPLTDGLGGTSCALMDIGVGAAGAEQVVVPNIAYSQDQWSGFSAGRIRLPVAIPAGSRVAARLQSPSSGYQAELQFSAINNGMEGEQRRGKVIDIGTSLTTSAGTALTPSTTGKSAWVQLTASLPQHLYGIVLMVGNKGVSVTTAVFGHIDIGVGAAGAEQVVVPDYPVGVDSNAELYLPLYSPLIPFRVPAGQRIAVRARASAAKAMYISLLGVG